MTLSVSPLFLNLPPFHSLVAHRPFFSLPPVLAYFIRSITPKPPGKKVFALPRSTPFSVPLQINHKSVTSNIQDDEERGIMIFAWWMAVLSDGYSSAYFRKKPILFVVTFPQTFH